MTKNEEVERSIITTFRKEIWRNFVKSIGDYDMIQDGDKIAVCMSGGKDSMLMAKCFQELRKHGKQNFEVVYMCMNPGYNEENKKKILDNAKLLDIPINMFETDIFNRVEHIEDSPCYLCARMRRGYLYENAKKLGCNKIALGHHFDDVIETVLMSMLYGAQMRTMMPKIRSTNHPGMELIRPMYLVKEEDILAWKKKNNLTFINCACRFTENCTISDEDGSNSKREEMKQLIKKLRKINPNVDVNIFRSAQNVNLDTLISYVKDGKEHHFLDEY
ncbi:MAG: tRNA 2-thiocytidine biosynthesis protein TtcA [Clostridia bacterium]|nr:tRNA 2-thiocytidine biosynthesis protein TtcA [Clostridia bacterium]